MSERLVACIIFTLITLYYFVCLIIMSFNFFCQRLPFLVLNTGVFIMLGWMGSSVRTLLYYLFLIEGRTSLYMMGTNRCVRVFGYGIGPLLSQKSCF